MPLTPHEIARSSARRGSDFAALVFGVFLLSAMLPAVGPEGVFGVTMLAAFGGCSLLAYFGVRQERLVLSPLILPIGIFSLTLVALAIDATRSVVADYFELMKYVAVFLFLFVGMNVSLRESEKKVTIYILLFSLVICVFGFCIVVFPARVAPLEHLYSRERFLGKTITFFHATYFASAVYALLASYLIFCIRRGSRFTAPALILVPILLALIVFTQSRASVFGAALLAVIYVLRIFAISRWFARLLLVIVATIAIVIIWQASGYLSSRLNYLFMGIRAYVLNWHKNVGRENSLGMRFEQAFWVIENNPYILWGAGIGKGYNRLLESWPTLYYYRYGLLGMAIYAVIWVGPLVRSAQLHLQGYRSNSPLFWGMPAFILTLPFFSLSSVITDQPHMAAMFYTMLGVYYANFMRQKGLLANREAR